MCKNRVRDCVPPIDLHVYFTRRGHKFSLSRRSIENLKKVKESVCTRVRSPGILTRVEIQKRRLQIHYFSIFLRDSFFTDAVPKKKKYFLTTTRAQSHRIRIQIRSTHYSVIFKLFECIIR